MKPPTTFRAQALVSFPFFAFGLVSLAALLAWLGARPGLVLEAPRSAQPLAWAHLAILGWLLTFVFGAAYQLIPVIAETRLWSRGLAWVHLALHVLATPRMVAALIQGDFASVSRWGAVVAFGVVLGVANLLLTASRRSRWSPDNIGLLFAIFWLTMTVALGVVLALSRVGPVVDIAPDRILRLHMACGTVGFFLGALVSVAFKLVPMFLLSAVRTHARAWASVVLLNVGLLLAVPGLLGELRVLTAASATMIASGLLLFVLEMVILVARRLRPLDWPLRSFLLGVAMLIPTTVVAIAGVLNRNGWEIPAPARPEPAVFLLGLFAVFTPCVLGMAGKIVPFLAWQWRYADHLGRARVPLVSELFNPALLCVQFVGHAVSCGAISCAVFLGSILCLQVGVAGLVVSILSYGTNIVLLARHIIHPRLAPLAPRVPLRPAASRARPVAQPL